jgi:hypothetical protein
MREAVTERTGAVPVDDSVRDLRERVERDARARLGQKRWTREYEAGRHASVESLLKDIDERSFSAAAVAWSARALRPLLRFHRALRLQDVRHPVVALVAGVLVDRLA